MKNYLKQILNPQQFEAATYVDWPSLILAGAGAWKTRTLTYKIAYIHSLWVFAENILAVTFTNKAANEMKERLNKILSEVNFEDDFDSLVSWLEKTPSKFNWIWTFHSIFLKILKQDIEHLNEILNSQYSKNFNIADESDALTLIRKILKDLWIKDSLTPREVKWKISTIKNQWLTAKDFLFHAKDESDEIIWKIYQKYEKLLREQNLLDFDDLLLLPYILFKKKPEILEKWKNKFKYILVDEAQDTNKIQFDLIYMLSWPNWNITLIWDDYQSIYWRRWAQIEEFLNAKKYWPDLKIFKLEINYRSKKTIVEAWNCIIKNNKNQYEKNIKANTDEETKIKIISFDSDVDEAVGIISLIKKLHEKWKKWSDFAIIYRINAQSEPFEKVLLTENIPYKIYWAFKFYERKEVKDILAYIKYLINPADWVSLLRIINVPNRKIWKTTIDAIQQIAFMEWKQLYEILQNIDLYDISSAGKNNIKSFTQLIEYLKQQIEDKPPAEIIKTIISTIKYKEYLIKEFWETEADERMANIGQLINTASKFNKNWVEWLKDFIDEISLLTDLDENDDKSLDKVNLMTAHASKWLEFDTVFLVWMEENIFPLQRAIFDPDELEEERRLAYVGVTRAKNNLFITYADSRMHYWSFKSNPVSRFVNEIPDELKTNFGFWKIVKDKKKFQIWDQVKHRLFWVGEVLEVFEDSVIVRFYWSGIKKILAKMLEKI